MKTDKVVSLEEHKQRMRDMIKSYRERKKPFNPEVLMQKLIKEGKK